MLMEQCAGKKLSLELGGDAPFIVFDDANIERVVKGAIALRYRNAGQTCVRANRILVQDVVYDAFTKRLAETVGAMKVADAVQESAKIVTGRQRAALGALGVVRSLARLRISSARSHPGPSRTPGPRRLGERSLLRQCDRKLVEVHSVFKHQLVQSLFP